MVIIIFGFSGAGKSTLAEKLGKFFGLRVIHPSSIVRNLLQNKPINIDATYAGRDFWESNEGIKLFKSRLGDTYPVDLMVDEILLKEIEKGNLSMDSWSMPWLSSKGIKIFLKAPHDVRMRRVARRSQVCRRRASAVVRLKDTKTRALYRRLGRFDMKKDRGVFDLILNVKEMSSAEVFNKAVLFIRTKKSPSKG